MNWSHLNIWAPGRKLAAAIRGRAAALRRVPRRKVGPTASKVEPGFDRWHEYEPLDSDRPRTTRSRSTPSAKVSAWRHRVLLKKGARLHADLGEQASRASLAILDEFGMVVAWYDRTRTKTSDEVNGKHFTHFYVPTDVVSAVPTQHLSAARVSSSHTGQGWRRHLDGRIYWGTTVIAPISMRDGRLQGYTHLTEESDGPWNGAALNSIRARVQEESAVTTTRDA